jgi:hypothetical protein
MWKFYKAVFRTSVREFWTATDDVLTGIAVLSFLAILLNRKYGEHLVTAWNGISPWWSLVPIGLLVIYRLLRANYENVTKLRAERDDLLGGIPKLVCKGVFFHGNPIVRRAFEMSGSPPVPTVMDTVVGTPVFYHLKIVNEPTNAINRKVAEKVAARVQMFNENGTPAATERLHRWEDSPSPAEAGKAADRLLPLDISPSGVEYKLDIAMKYDEDDAFHTPNNETVLKGSPDWREEEFKFPPGTYIAEIHFRGANVVTDLKCQIVNRGKGAKLEITPLD